MANSTDVPGTYIDTISHLDVALTILGSSLSIIGALVFFYAHYLRWKNGILLDEPRKYLLFLTIADFFNAFGYLWGVAQFLASEDNGGKGVLACHVVKEAGCVAQSFVTTSFSMSSFFWTTLIAFHLFWTYGNDPHYRVGYERSIIYHVAGWIIPILITTLAATQDVLGSDLTAGSGAWCWISACLSEKERTIWMTVTGKGWEILMYFCCCAFYLLIKWRKIKKQRQTQIAYSMSLTSRYASTQENSDGQSHEDIRFLLLWLIEVGLRIFGTVRYLTAAVQRHTNQTLSDYNSVNTIFLHFQSFGDSAQALCSCLLFCIFDRDTRTLLKNKLTCKENRDREDRPILERAVSNV